jgi:DNA adenine methylase
MYIDPPYAGTKGMYFGGFDNNKLFEWLKIVKCKWAMSYDGISGKIDNTYNVPEDLYDEHIYIKSGNSSFKRVIGKSKDSIVYESLYLKNDKGN